MWKVIIKTAIKQFVFNVDDRGKHDILKNYRENNIIEIFNHHINPCFVVDIWVKNVESI